ncbi:MAG: PIN domain-containing protein [Verrucomicrobiota bacterium]|nr:PIN domain-containing protein [Verrucomicrobiota bacterium]
MKIYFDACCWNRPFDDQSQHRVRLEAEAVLSILEMSEAGELEVAGSDIIDGELSQMPDEERREKVELLLALASSHIALTPAIERRATGLQGLNFAPWDALHLAAAESARADCFLTTDDELLRKANRRQANLKVKVENPAKWLIQKTTDEN